MSALIGKKIIFNENVSSKIKVRVIFNKYKSDHVTVVPKSPKWLQQWSAVQRALPVMVGHCWDRNALSSSSSCSHNCFRGTGHWCKAELCFLEGELSITSLLWCGSTENKIFLKLQ